MNFVKLYVGDYLRDTGTLTVAEHGAYLLMLVNFYATEKPLPTGRELHRLLRAETRQDREAIDAVAAKFWTESDGGLVNARAIKEIERASHQRAVNQEIGKRGGRPKRTEQQTESVSESVSTSGPNRNPNQTPDTRQESPSEPLHLLPLVGGSGPALRTAPPPAPPFDGSNAEILNGKHVVPLAVAWELPEAWGDDAEALGWKPGEILREAEKFRQYWVAGRGAGQRRSVKGWRQSWSTWLDKAARDKR